MFNESIKMEFFMTKKHAKKIMEPKFDQTEEFEKRLNRDVAEFDKSDILDYYRKLHTCKIKTLININSQLKTYADYYYSKNNIEGCNAFSDITNQELKSCIDLGKQRIKVLTYDEIQNGIKNLMNPAEQFIILALFEGLGGKALVDLHHIRVSDLCNGTTKLASGRSIPISDQLFSLAQKASESIEYYQHTKNGDLKTVLFKTGDDRIIKAYCNEGDNTKNRRQVIYNRFKRAVASIGMDELEPRDIHTSGGLHFINEVIKAEGLSPYDAIVKYHTYINERFEDIPSIITYIETYKDYLISNEAKAA